MIAEQEHRQFLEKELFDVVLPAIDSHRNLGNYYLCGGRLESAADIAILDAALYRYTLNKHYQDKARQRICDSLSNIIQEPFRLRFMGGHIGTFWMADLIDPDCIDIHAKTEFLSITLQHICSNKTRKVEFMSGLSGVGIALHRFVGFPDAVEALSRIVDIIANQAIWDQNGCYWPPLTPTEDGYVSLGYAHGLSGVVDFLASECLRRSITPGLANTSQETTILRTLRGACDWMINQLSKHKAPTYPSRILLSRPDPFEMPGGNVKTPWWCNGSSGMISPLLKARQVFQETSWEVFIDKLIKDSCPDLPWESTICASGHCHGYLGNVMALSKAYDRHRRPECIHAAKQWYGKFYNRILSFGPQRPIGEEAILFKYNWDSHSPKLFQASLNQMVGWETGTTGYLMGLSGIGASLAMLLDGRHDQWGLEMIMFN